MIDRVVLHSVDDGWKVNLPVHAIERALPLTSGKSHTSNNKSCLHANKKRSSLYKKVLCMGDPHAPSIPCSFTAIVYKANHDSALGRQFLFRTGSLILVPHN